jgi:poly(3-hydroxybutyrate) depolymerase
MPAAEGYHTLMVGARPRRFFLRLPADYDGKKAWPVIFAFHGAGNKDGNWFDTHTGLRAQNEAHAVLVFGESLYRPGSTTERSWQDEGQLPDNLAYVDATLAWLKKNVCVDPGRLFAAGQSSGAYFSQTLGCHRGDVFRAVASSDGGERLFADCKGHPGAFVRYRPSGLNAPDSLRVLAFWKKHNECGATKMPTNTPPCSAYQCAGDVQLWECSDNGAHDWPTYMDKGVWSFFSLFK